MYTQDNFIETCTANYFSIKSYDEMKISSMAE